MSARQALTLYTKRFCVLSGRAYEFSLSHYLIRNEQGTHKQLMKKSGAYRELYEKQLMAEDEVGEV